MTGDIAAGFSTTACRDLGLVGSSAAILARASILLSRCPQCPLLRLTGRLIHAQEERARPDCPGYDGSSQRMAFLQIGLEQLKRSVPR